ncbi:MAG TPA: hypothetical protein VD713_00755, partial [Sphingomonadales bacterium]|nr:hypothetical protein [Sphingomonadales bacterium]
SAPPTIFNNDLMVGARLSFNDAADSSVLAGWIADLETGSMVVKVEAATRLRNGLKLEVDVWIFPHAAESDIASNFERDHMIRLRLLKYF